ncbi:MAG: S8 family peptidase [Woeseiaceae bacterium]|nr:S8 family peptidase [Gammaproteobacteria bacterium]NNF49210.1 S8 family peptidase [Woeseiaceae bacterium]NNK26201.1 S8 family peptidase [Woeseiaceae bacterium]
MNFNELIKASFTMKRSTGLLAIAAAIVTALAASGSNENRVDVAATVLDATATQPAGQVAVAGIEAGQRRAQGRAAASSDYQDWPTSLPQYARGSDVTMPSTPVYSAAASTRNPSITPDTEGSRAVAPRDKMSGPVAALLDAGASGYAELVVRYSERPELFDDEVVAELGGEVVRSYEHLAMRAIRLPVAALEDLASEDKVDWLSLDEPVSATSVSSRQAANLPASGSANSGYDGQHVGIAVVDTGVSKHGDLSSNILQYSFVGGKYPKPEIDDGELERAKEDSRDDRFGHGTHVAGLIAGSGSNSNDDYKGSAPGATILALQVLDKDGNGSMSDVMAALDWLLTYGRYFNVRVVNLSLGKGVSESNTTDPLVLAAERLWDAGMVVVAAAGNDGYEGSMTITSPGNSRKIITVGSITDNGTGLDSSDDYTSSFSSQGPTIGDYVLKPDLLAPGNRVVGSVDKNSKLATILTDRIKECTRYSFLCGDSTYLELSGTSMATPLVSAAAALMLEKDPSLNPATVKARLMRSARKIDADPSETGAGVLDVEAALDDSGVVADEALSPLMVFDDASDTVLVEDTAVLWGDDTWSAAYLYNNGLNWASGATYTDENGVTAKGYMWTDRGVTAKGYMWTSGGVSAKGYMWTGGMRAKSLLEPADNAEYILNDDAPSQ